MKLRTLSRVLSMILVLVFLVTGCQSPLPATNSEQKNVSANEGRVGEKVDTDTIIIGGGIAGLTSAFYLNDNGKDFILLEKEKVVGGKAINGVKDNFYYAKGTEYIGEPESILSKMIRELGIELLEIPSPMDIHYANGKKYYGDIGLVLHMIEESSVDEFNRFVKEVLDVYDEYEELPNFDSKSRIARLDKITAAEWFKEKKFSKVYYDTYNVTSKGLFGATLEEVSALNMIPEIAFDFLKPIKYKEEHVEMLKKYNKPFKSRKGSEAYSFKKGMSEIPLAIYDKLKSNIRLSSFVKQVDKVDGVYHVTYDDLEKNETHVLTSNNVIIAVPSPIVPLMAKNLLTENQLETLNKIPYASYITAALYTDSYIVNEAFDTAVPDGYFFTDIYDSTWVQREYDSKVSESENSILSLYIAPPSYKSDILKNMDDKTVLKNIYTDFDKIPGYENVKNHVTGYDIYHIEYAYPIMVPGAYERLQKLHSELNGSLQLAGDYMVYPTIEGAVESGAIAAKKIINK